MSESVWELELELDGCQREADRLERLIDDQTIEIGQLQAEVERLRNTEAWDEVERLRGVVERLQVEKHDLAEKLGRAERQWDAVRK
jgi:predicted  nucleic acid-binding Zn-ribbon protein